MKRFASVLLLIVWAGLCPGAVITLTNQGFELGDLSGWSTSGSSAAVGTVTVDNWTVGPNGSYMAQLAAEGSTSVGDLESFFGVTSGLLSTNLPPGNATNGTGIYQDFSGSAGDTVTMYWAYVATDHYPYNDPAFVVVTGPNVEQLTVLASIWNGGITVGDYGATGWHAFTYTLPATGSYRLGFGVVNTQDQAVPGYLFLDNGPGTLAEIPEPGSLLLVGSGLLGLRRLRRS